MMCIVTPLLCSAQNTQRFTASKVNEYGLTYSLPITTFDIVVSTELTDYVPGEFSNYASRYLALTDVIRTADKTTTVTGIEIIPRGIADPDNRWLVQFKAGASVSMFLSASGIPLSINTEDAKDPAAAPQDKTIPPLPTPLQTDAARQAVTAEMTRSTSTAKRAELASQRIFELREQRNELISGNADNMPPDGSALKVALAGLDAQEAALTAMFAGTQSVTKCTQHFSFTPTSEVTDTLIARISPVKGIVSSNDLSGIPLTVSFKIVEEGKLPLTEKGEPKKFPKGGVAYCIPGVGEITVKFNGKTLATSTFDVAQLGCVFGIDPALFTDKRSPMQAIFSPVTGAITSLTPIEQKQ